MQSVISALKKHLENIVRYINLKDKKIILKTDILARAPLNLVQLPECNMHVGNMPQLTDEKFAHHNNMFHQT